MLGVETFMQLVRSAAHFPSGTGLRFCKRTVIAAFKSQLFNCSRNVLGNNSKVRRRMGGAALRVRSMRVFMPPNFAVDLIIETQSQSAGRKRPRSSGAK